MSARMRSAIQQLHSIENPDDPSSPSLRRWNATPLPDHETYLKEGVPGVMSAQGYEISWVEYMGYMYDQLEELTGGM
jgi:hypothetical protein